MEASTSYACSSQDCSGKHCSCSIASGKKHGLEVDFDFGTDDDIFLRLDVDLQTKTDSKSSTTDGEDQSFRESFYSSGTDWSCLYTVDDYGIPCETSENSIRVSSGNLDFNDQLKTSDITKPCLKASNGKFVQSTLSACWGLKTPKTSNDDVKVTEQRNAAKSDIWSKFQRPAAFSAKVTAPKTQNRASKAFNKQESQSSGKNCPFYKKIQGTNFTVDAFKYGAIKGCSAYFLTHFHADHYGGLTKGWVHGPIYCSPVTARLLSVCLNVENRWIHPIPLGTDKVIDGVEVRLMDANHCPGAVLILFKLKGGQCILHTGDFRASKAMQSYTEFRNCSIHTLYLDTTYCNEKYSFPSQKEVIDFVVQVTKDALEKNSKTLVVVGAYSIGKERVYLGISEALNVPIFAEKRRIRLLKALEWPEVETKLCADANITLLHVLPIGHLRPQKLKSYLKGFPKFNNVLAFRPTGWTFSEKVGNQLHLLKPQISGNITVYGVPYSEHSSFNELQEFVKFTRPEKIIPTVNIGRSQERERMQAFFKQWLIKEH